MNLTYLKSLAASTAAHIEVKYHVIPRVVDQLEQQLHAIKHQPTPKRMLLDIQACASQHSLSKPFWNDCGSRRRRCTQWSWGHFHPPRGHWACDLPTFALDDYQAALVGPPPACPMFMTLSLSSCRKPAECIANADAA